MPHPPFITQSSWDESVQTFKPKHGDVWVSTYPKCGTTFMEQIILLMQQQGDASRMDPSTQNSYSKEKGIGKVWVEASVRPKSDTARMRTITTEDFAALPSPRLLKTHAPWHMFLARAQTPSGAGQIVAGTKVEL